LAAYEWASTDSFASLQGGGEPCPFDRAVAESTGDAGLKSGASTAENFLASAFKKSRPTRTFSLRDLEPEPWKLGIELRDSIIATAILKRLLHHSTTVNIRAESSELKDRRRPGLVPPRGQEGVEIAVRSLTF
jgi:hypothetical protein